jgi:RimJ/RimL family protein N-acetyltransferase
MIKMDELKVRPLVFEDIPYISHYWKNASADYLKAMGADIAKMPPPEDFEEMLAFQLQQPFEAKKAYALIWEINGKPSGHSNINEIEFGNQAKIHLHLWSNENRNKGAGTKLVKRSLPFYIDNFRLKKLVCEPYALNPGPNKLLEKVGFKFIRRYTTVPGSLNFEQEVNRWEYQP